MGFRKKKGGGELSTYDFTLQRPVLKTNRKENGKTLLSKNI